MTVDPERINMARLKAKVAGGGKRKANEWRQTQNITALVSTGGREGEEEQVIATRIICLCKECNRMILQLMSTQKWRPSSSPLPLAGLTVSSMCYRKVKSDRVDVKHTLTIEKKKHLRVNKEPPECSNNSAEHLTKGKSKLQHIGRKGKDLRLKLACLLSCPCLLILMVIACLDVVKVQA